MKFRYFFYALLIFAAIPILFLATDKYIYVNTFPYGGYIHASAFFTRIYALTLLTASLLGIIFGVIWPRLTIWTTEAKRIQVLGYYSVVFIISILTFFESYTLNFYVFNREKSSLANLYELISPGLPKSEAINIAEKFSSSLSPRFVDYVRFLELEGFPFRGRDNAFIAIQYPGLVKQARLILEMAEPLDSSDVSIKRIILLDGKDILSAKPPITESTPQIFKGILEIGPDRQTFTLCESETPMWLDLSEIGDDSLMNSYESSQEFPYQKRYSTLAGAVEPQMDCDACQQYGQSFKIFYVSGHSREKSYSCDLRI